MTTSPGIYKAEDGTEWLDMLGGLYIGRTPSGMVRIALTVGLPPWEKRSNPTIVQLQPEAFAVAARTVLRIGMADAEPQVLSTFFGELRARSIGLEASACIYEARRRDGSSVEWAWCRTHGWDCPNSGTRDVGQSLDDAGRRA